MSDASPSNEDQPRRNFLVAIASLVIGGVISLFSLLIGMIVFLDPIMRRQKPPKAYRKRGSAAEGFIRVASSDSIPKDGMPMRFPVISDMIDAWTFSPNQPIGAVFISRNPKTKKLLVLHSTCPHAGCAVSLAADAKQFNCPCHNSAFDMKGDKVDLPGKENPSPRPMDQLEFQEKDGEILVKFENFYTGIHEKKRKI